jgi:tetratricopeptide (TPR) repeat protein
MYKIIFCTLLVFAGVAKAQTSLTLTDQMDMVTVNDVPANRKPKGADNLLFVYQYEPAVLFFGFLKTENTLQIIGKFTEDVEGFNAAKSNCTFSNDTITLWSQYPFRASESTYTFTWDGKRMRYLSVTYYDPSEEAIGLAEKALVAGKLQEAIDYYYSVQYPSSYLNEDMVGHTILAKANVMAMGYFKNKQYSQAAGCIDTALGYYTLQLYTEPQTENAMNQLFEDNYAMEYKDSFGLFMGNYGYYLYKADSLEKSIQINEWLNHTFPHLAGPYLQRADALFDQGKTADAKPVYKLYIERMKEKNKEKSIPQRVFDRTR